MKLNQYKNNEVIPMTRRYPNLPGKVLRRDSAIAHKLVKAWDMEHSSYKVLEIFSKEKENLSDERYWETLRTVWVLTGSVERSAVFRQWMLSTRKCRYYFSTPEEAKRLRELPDKIEIFRATNDPNDGGLSWTLSRAYAESYQKLYDKKLIITSFIEKKEVFALIERNKEEEIILL